MTTSIKKLIFGSAVSLAALFMVSPAQTQAGHGHGVPHWGGSYGGARWSAGRGAGVGFYRPYRPGYRGYYGSGISIGISPGYVGTYYQQPYLSGPVPGQLYLVPAAFFGAVPGTLIQYGGYTYVIGSGGTMTLY